jgi:ATP-dependent helicase/nuclease subunit A
MTQEARAAQEQLEASNPAVSAFVSAHAGAGKTKLLIDRLLRLMLANLGPGPDNAPADPGRILCLTFTKAAAAEMAIRLQRRLGHFVTLTDEALNAELKTLHITPDPKTRARARELFARVLDLPGGMRISTIHAFCQSLLRRFPLEAGLSPHFRLAEEQGADARALLDQARETILPAVPPSDIEALAGLITADGFASLVRQLEHHRERLKHALALPAPALRAALRRAAGATAETPELLLQAAVTWPAEPTLRAALQHAARDGSPAVAEKARRMLGWLNLPPDLRAEHWEHWTVELFTKSGDPRALSTFCNANLARAHPHIQPLCAAEQTRVLAVQAEQRAMATADASAALLTLAAPMLAAYEQAKTRAGLLDYDDLIRRTNTLLGHAGAAWVKYKLDGGIDHLLLDEVQDTAPPQWNVTDALTDDFFAGEGARADLHRTVFAVGDKKQSIYGFQGAEPEQFATHQHRYRALVHAARGPQSWRSTMLDVSFRSTPPVLAAVDAIFAQPLAATGVCEPGTVLRHHPNRAGQAGTVTLWPLAPRTEAPAPEPWIVPDRYHAARSAPETLVAELAAWIHHQTTTHQPLHAADRDLRAGDFLILVRRRGAFDRALVRELKKLGVPVAGLDRMVLTEQPAVQDLMSLCEALLLPDNDLSLAEMLTSPLGGLTDDSLMALCAGRAASLWEILRTRAAERADWQNAEKFFGTLLARADFTTPYGLLAEALGPLGARARLFARLGPEAAEPVDELLAAALQFANLHPPSLQGFLHWLRQSGAEVKREAEAAGDTVRIMTVHGAKGLEAPVVILPDTTGLPPEEDRLHWTTDPQTGTPLFLWAPRQEFTCPAITALKQQAADRRAAEYNRLLYVALTRARDHLLICGWQPRAEVPATAWYALAQAGLAAAHATLTPHTWGEALTLTAPQTARPDSRDAPQETSATAPPPWAGAAPLWQPAAAPPEPAIPRPLAPSRPEGANLGAVPPARSPLLAVPHIPGRATAADRGSLIHALLQHLPDLPPPARRAAAIAYAARTIPTDAPTLAPTLAESVLAILENPAFAPLFGPGSRAEQALTGLVAGQIVTGRIDRLVITPTEILIADYKTARTPPASPDRVPVLYLRQLAAYRAVLRLLYPARPVRCLLIWTEGPVAMPIPDNLLDSHAPGTGSSTSADQADPLIALPAQAISARTTSRPHPLPQGELA